MNDGFTILRAARAGVSEEAVLLAILGLTGLLFFARAVRRDMQGECQAGMGLVVFGFCTGFAFTLATETRYLAALLLIATLACYITGLILAIRGLLGLRRSPAPRPKGLVCGVLAVALGAWCLLSFARGLVTETLRELEQVAARRAPPPEAPLADLTFAEYNFALKHPGGEWMQLDPRVLNPDACLILGGRDRRAIFYVIAEELTTREPSQPEVLAEFVRARAHAWYDDPEQSGPTSASLGSLEGLEIVTRGTRAGSRSEHRTLVLAHGGFAYQLGTVCLQSPDECVEIADQLRSGFRVLDESRQPPARVPVGDYRNEALGVELDGLAPHWAAWATLGQDDPLAVFGGLSSTGRAFTLHVHGLEGEDPPSATLANALLSRFGFSLADRRLREVTLSAPEGASAIGAWTATLHVEDGLDAHYLFQVLRAGDRAALLASWSPIASEADIETLAEPWQRLRFKHPERSHDTALTASQRDARIDFYGALAEAAASGRQHGAARRWRERASRLAPDDPGLLASLIAATHRDHRTHEALALSSDAEARFPDDLALASWTPFLLDDLGRRDEAIVSWRRLFARGYRDEEDLLLYLRALRTQDRAREALPALRSLAGDASSFALVELEAELLGDLSRHDEAIEALEGLQAPRTFQPRIAWALIRACDRAGRHSQQLAAVDRLIAEGHASGQAWLWKADAEQSLGWPAMAKVSLERALELEPTNPEIHDFLRVVSGELGEGDNSSVKTPLDPVELPPELLEELPPEPVAGAGDGHQAWIHHSLLAFSWTESEPLRRTLSVRLRVVDPEGVDAFSTLRFRFDPLSERIFVNDVTVRGPRGSIMGRADRSDSYVLDADALPASHDQDLHVPVPGLRPNSELSYVVTWEDLSPTEDFRFHEHFLAGTHRARRRGLYITGDLDELVVTTKGQVEVRESESGRAWVVDSHDGIPREPMQAEWADFVPLVRVSDAGATWEGEAESYLEDLIAQLSPEPSVEQVARSLTARADGVDERVGVLARYVQEACSYTAIEFGRRSRIPARASEVLERRYGDCKDHALLLHQLLRATGVRSHLALVSTVRRTSPLHPSLDQFNHMIVHVPGARVPFVDVTDKHLTTSIAVPFGLGGRRALILDANAPRLVEIPRPDSSQSVLRLERSMELGDDDALEVAERVAVSGYLAAWLRGWLAARSPDERARGMEALLGRGAALEVRELGVTNLRELDDDLRIQLNYRIAGWAASVGDTRVGRLPAPWERAFLAPTPVRLRRTPFEFVHPFRLESRARFRGGRISRERPPSLEDENDLLQRSVSAQHDGDDVLISAAVAQRGGPHLARRFAAYAEGADEVLHALELHVALDR